MPFGHSGDTIFVMNEPINSDPRRSTDLPLSSRVLRRVRNEFMLEIGFVLLCIVLAIGLEAKVALAVVLACLKFAIPDWITAYLVLRYDPGRAHSLGMLLLFVAAGLVRASVFAFVALFAGAFLFEPVFAQLGWRNPAAVGLGAGFICAFSFLGTVFPLTLAATLISFVTDTKYSFATALTRLRRRSESDQSSIELDIESSLNRMGVASGISLAVCITGLLFLLPLDDVGPAFGLTLLAAAFVLPFVWMPIFVMVTRPGMNGLQPHD